VLRDGQLESSAHDMGGDIVPDFVARGDAGVYDLKGNEVPGSNDRDKYYWRDVGTIDSFFDAHMDLIAPVPVFNLYNQDWPIFNQQTNLPPAKFVRDANGNTGATVDSIVSLGCLLSGAQVERSVIGPWCGIDSGSKVLDSIVFERASIGAGSIVNRSILDKDVVLAPGAQVGVDREADLARGFTVTDSGITVVGKGVRVEA
jgi:glucose-1-phosphate adenylyltransferase